MTINIKALQRRLGVADDGIMGRNTLRALFARCGASPSIAGELALGANVHFRDHGILDNGLRLAHFMAQVGHESGGFRWMEEIWGPTKAQLGYEGRADLGNTVKGDGRRYAGRGPLQITGRANYRRIGQQIGIDLESHPEIAALPSLGILTACLYWTSRKINAMADRDDVLAVTKAVNGGTNGLEDRKLRLVAAKALIL
jgi:putative chitinase